MYSVSDETRKPIFEGVQGENEAREIQFDVTAWVEELGEGVCTATAKRPTDTTPYPVTVTRSGNVVTWKPNSTDTSIEGIGAFQLAFSINDVVAKTRIWNTKIAPSLVGAGDPPDPYDDWIQDLRDIAAETLTYSQNAANSADDAEAEKLESEAWAKGTKNGTPVPSTADQYHDNAKYYSEESYKNAEAWAVGQRGGVDVPSTDPTYENNAKYWAEQSLANQYGAYIVKSASGDIASFNDGADDVPMKSLNVTITPKQSGSGDPSPSNVRAISGWTGANVTVTGFNLFDKSTATDDKYYDYQGVERSSTGKCHSAIIRVKPNTSYYTTGYAGVGFYSVLGIDSDGNAIPSWYGGASKTAPFTMTTPSNCQFVYLNFNLDQKDTIIFCESNVAVEFEPFTGITTAVPLGQTVYGGEVNPISGEMVIDKASVDMGTVTWISGYNGFYANASTLPSEPKNYFAGICSCYSYGGAYSVCQNNQFGYIFNYIPYVKDSAYSDAAAFKTAMTGQTLVYELATPTTVQLTPAQVASLLGENNVWADCGAVEVEYRADPTLAYNELANVIVSLGGNL